MRNCTVKYLNDDNSFIKVIVGEYESLSSPIPADSRQLLLHIHLKANEQLTLPLNERDEYAIFSANGCVEVSGELLRLEEQAYLAGEKDSISIVAKEDVDLFLYGGEKYQEPIVSAGPFVMNTEGEITQAYSDYHKGLYGNVDYQHIKS